MKKARGFTIVELLVVIVTIAILATIVFVTYNGVQTKARVAKIESDLKNVQKLVETYKTFNGTYPVTTTVGLNPNYSTSTAFTDANCKTGTQQSDWVPGLNTGIPQTDGQATGVGGYVGCYIYVSDGTSYVISAWNMLKDPQTDKMYRRLGFREMDQSDPSHWNHVFYICNNTNVGGSPTGTYNAAMDYYKHSMTISNITDCNETPPAGA